MTDEARQLFSWCTENELYDDAMVCLHRIDYLREPGTEQAVNVDLQTVLRKQIKKLEEQGLWEKIAVCFKKAFKLFPAHPLIHFELGCFLHRSGNILTAISEFKESLRINPNSSEVKLCLENAKSQAVDQWHFRMLNDRNRNDSYRTAIFNELNKCNNKIVLDIGTGTGILSIIAAQKCDKVYACESSNIMYKICENVLQVNGLTENITVFNKSSLDLSVPNDIPEKVSVVITEVFDAGLLGESALSTLKHAWDHLLLPPCCDSNIEGQFGRVIPKSATIYACLVECKWLRRGHRLITDHFGPIDFSNVKVEMEMKEPYNSEYLPQIPGGYKVLTKPLPICNVDFNNPSKINDIITGCVLSVCFQCVTSGTVDCVALWFDLELDENTKISTSPECDSCWEQAVFPVVDIIHLEENEMAEVSMIVKEPMQLMSVSVKGKPSNERSNLRSIALNSDWIRKLNSPSLASHLMESLKSFRDNNNNYRVLDHQLVPLVALLVTKLQIGSCTVSNVELEAKFLELCFCLGLSPSNVSFLSIEDCSAETSDKYDLIFYDPVHLSGVFRENIFQDVALLSHNMLNDNGLVFPKRVTLYGVAVECPLYNSYGRVRDENLLGIKISEVMNAFQTNYQEDIWFSNKTGALLTKQVQLMEIESCSQSACTKTSVCKAGVVQTGTMNSFLYWAGLSYGENALLNTFDCDDLFSLAAFTLDVETNLNRTDVLEIKCDLICSVPQFQIDKAKIKQ